MVSIFDSIIFDRVTALLDLEFPYSKVTKTLDSHLPKA